MKNQNDLIVSISIIVVFLIVFFVCMGTRPQPIQPAPPAQVELSEPAYPTGTTPVMANALPGGGTSGGGGGGAMGRPGAAGASAPSGPQQASMTSTSSPGAKAPGR